MEAQKPRAESGGDNMARILNWRITGYKLPDEYKNKVTKAIQENDIDTYKALVKQVRGGQRAFKLWSLTFCTIKSIMISSDDYKKDRREIFEESLKICPEWLKENLDDNLGGSPVAYLAAACQSSTPEARKLAAEYIDMMLDLGFDPCETAYNACFPELVSVLVRHGVDLNRLDAYGRSPYFANLEKHWTQHDSVNWLDNLLKYADPNLKISPTALLGLLPGQEVPTLTAVCALMYTSSQLMADNTPEMHIKKLLEHGADPNAEIDVNYRRFVKGMTALHIAKKPGIAKALLEAGADPNKPDEQRYTPLLCAVMGTPSNPSMNQETFEILLNAGADPSAKNFFGDTLLHIAAEKGNIKSVMPYLKDMIESGLDVNAQNNSGKTCMHCLMSGPDGADICANLIRCGADPNIQDKDGNTPLHTMYDSEMLETCLSMGADPNIRNKYGRTPLHEFFIRWGRDKDVMQGQLTEDILRIYSKYGADLQAKDNNDKTLVDYIPLKRIQNKISALIRHLEDTLRYINEDIDIFAR